MTPLFCFEGETIEKRRKEDREEEIVGQSCAFGTWLCTRQVKLRYRVTNRPIGAKRLNIVGRNF